MLILHPPSSGFIAFNIHFHYYSIIMFVAIAVCFVLAVAFSDIFDRTDREVVIDFSPWMILCSIIGARLYYVLLSLDYYLQNLTSIFMVWKGGISIHGAIIGAVIFGLIYFKLRGLKFLPYADLFALVLPLGQAIGRWGNFFNQEAFGGPLHNSIVALFIDDKYRPRGYHYQGLYHPAFLYESVLDLFVFILLFHIMKKTAPDRSGLVFFSYIALYSVVRIIIEPIRLDTVSYLFNIPFPVIVSIIGIVIGLIGISYIKSKP